MDQPDRPEPESRRDADDGSALADENALLRAALGEARDRLDELESSNDADPLTGLPGECALADEVARAAAQARRHGTPAALLLLDIRGLDAINAGHGRVGGDAALLHVSRLLETLIRGTDAAFRAGSSFAVLLDHLDPDSAVETGDRIARCIAAAPLDLGRVEVRLESSIGVASILPGDEAMEVLARARRNLERVKQF